MAIVFESQDVVAQEVEDNNTVAVELPPPKFKPTTLVITKASARMFDTQQYDIIGASNENNVTEVPTTVPIISIAANVSAPPGVACATHLALVLEDQAAVAQFAESRVTDNCCILLPKLSPANVMIAPICAMLLLCAVTTGASNVSCCGQ